MRNCLALLVASSLLLSCTSYDGEKLDPATVGHRKLKGIPYVLSKPEFTLTRTTVEGEARPTYSVGLSYVPDSSQLYTLVLDPTVFVDPEFTVNFGPGSRLISANAKFTEQITPVITALGTFATNVAGVLIKALADSETVRSSIAKAMQAQSTCNRGANPPQYQIFKDWRRIKNYAAPSKVSAVIGERMFFLYSDDKEFTQSFPTLSDDEVECLKDAGKSLLERADEAEQKKLTAFKASLTDLVSNSPNEPLALETKKAFDDQSFTDIQRVTEKAANKLARLLGRAAVIELALDKDASLEEEILKHGNAFSDEASFVADLRASLVTPETLNAFAAQQNDALKQVQAVNQVIKDAEAMVVAASTEAVVKAIESITSLAPDARRGRLLMYLQSIRERSKLHLASPAPAVYQNDIRNIERLVERVVDRPDLYQQRQVLEKQIARVWPDAFVSSGAQSAAAPPYVQARQELDEVNKRISDEQTKIISAALPPKTKPAEPIKGERLTVKLKKDFKEAAGKDDPQFIVVLEEY